jgi:hypothetical protein
LRSPASEAPSQSPCFWGEPSVAVGGPGDQDIIKDAALGKIRAAHMTTKLTKDGVTTTVTKTMPFLSPGLVDAAAKALDIDRGEEAGENGGTLGRSTPVSRRGRSAAASGARRMATGA